MRNKILAIISVVIAIFCMSVGFSAYAADTTDTNNGTTADSPTEPDVEPIVLDESNSTVSLSVSTYTYNGKAHKPTVAVKYDGTMLTENTDYKIKYSSNKNAGTAKVTVTGIGDYTGTLVKTFNIKPKTITAKVSLSFSETTFTGNAFIPDVTVKDGSKVLDTSDYTVSYKDNTKPGIATVTVTGKGNYKFTAEKTFKIKPKNVTGFKVTSNDSSSIKLSWNGMSDITEYRIYVYDSNIKDYKYVGKTTSNSYTVYNLSTSTKYSFRIRAAKYSNDKYVYSGFSYVKSATKPKSTTLTSVTRSGSTVKVKWNKTYCTGYRICYTTDSKFKKNVKYIYVSGSSKSSYVIKGLSKKATYYCKIQPYKIDANDKKHYAPRSSMLSTDYGNLYASYSSYYVNNPNRTNNLKLASKAINGTIVQPGQTFSFNATVGQRTTAKGYKPAPIFAGADSVQDGVGGGICQVASTMFNTALLANVKITERSQHSQRVAYVPLGRDAAIFWGSQDFKWTNNTDYPIKIKMSVKDGKVNCQFFTSVDKKPKKVSINVTQSGNRFKLTRTVSGKVNYTAYSTY